MQPNNDNEKRQRKHNQSLRVYCQKWFIYLRGGRNSNLMLTGFECATEI